MANYTVTVHDHIEGTEHTYEGDEIILALLTPVKHGGDLDGQGMIDTTVRHLASWLSTHNLTERAALSATLYRLEKTLSMSITEDDGEEEEP